MNVKADASNASVRSNINTPKINVKRGIGKPCAVEVSMSRHVYLIQKSLCDAHSYGEGADKGKFDAVIDTKKEA